MLCLSGLLQQALQRYGEAPALLTLKGEHTYRELDLASQRLASFLAQNGIGAGDRIALHLRSCAEYVIADLAILKLAAVKVPLNELMSPSELSYCLKHSEASVLISHASLPRPAGDDRGRDGISHGRGKGERRAVGESGFHQSFGQGRQGWPPI